MNRLLNERMHPSAYASFGKSWLLVAIAVLLTAIDPRPQRSVTQEIFAVKDQRLLGARRHLDGAGFS